MDTHTVHTHTASRYNRIPSVFVNRVLSTSRPQLNRSITASRPTTAFYTLDNEDDVISGIEHSDIEPEPRTSSPPPCTSSVEIVPLSNVEPSSPDVLKSQSCRSFRSDHSDNFPPKEKERETRLFSMSSFGVDRLFSGCNEGEEVCNESRNQSLDHSNHQSFQQSLDQSNHQSFQQSLDQSNHQSLQQSLDQSNHQSLDQLNHQSLQQSLDQSNDQSEFFVLSASYEDDRIARLLGLNESKTTPGQKNPLNSSLCCEIPSDSEKESEESEINKLIDDLMEINDCATFGRRFELSMSLKDSISTNNFSQINDLLKEIDRLKTENHELKQRKLVIPESLSQNDDDSADGKAQSIDGDEVQLDTSHNNNSETKSEEETKQSVNQSQPSSPKTESKKAIAFDITLNSARRPSKKPSPSLHNGPLSGPIATKPSQCTVNRPTNKRRIILALKKNILAGGVNQNLLNQVLEALEAYSLPEGGFFVLSLTSNLQFRGIYVFENEHSDGNLLFGIGSQILTFDKVACTYNYDTGLGRFIQLTASGFSVRIDAVVLRRKKRNLIV
ncbi:hypothetical protein P9112_004586 [Eukaryota sp. TZLM1-RC]